MVQADVLIAGAGPTGLVLALWLTRLGIKVRIVDKTDAPGTTSRALAVQARTLELYRQLDLTDDVLARGHKVPGINLWVRGKRQTRVSLAGFAGDITPYGPVIFPQDQHERLLIARLEEMGVAVERKTELISYRQDADRVVAECAVPLSTSTATGFFSRRMFGKRGARAFQIERGAIRLDAWRRRGMVVRPGLVSQDRV